MSDVGQWTWDTAKGDCPPGMRALYEATADMDKVRGTWWLEGKAGESTICYPSHGGKLYCVAAYYDKTMTLVRLVITRMRGNEET